ncbi:MAG: hypothetical protein ABI343_01085 [Burkholderiaceae bacterium]
MKYPTRLFWLMLLVLSCAHAQSQTPPQSSLQTPSQSGSQTQTEASSASVAEAEEQAFTLRDSAERERIHATRSREQTKFTAQEAQCYKRFAVNDCLIEVRARKREVLGDLRRQEISLNDTVRKRRAADQLLRSDARLQH